MTSPQRLKKHRLQLDRSDLEPEQFYWAQLRDTRNTPEVVRISTIFGDGRDFWSVARTGTDVHAMLDEFEFLSKVIAADAFPHLRAAE